MRSDYQKNKKKAWSAFSKWVRMSSADKNGMVKCVTCPTVKHWKEMDAGHYLPGRNNSILFDENQVHPQCKQCNIFKSGNPNRYEEYMVNKYGQEKINEMRLKQRMTVKINSGEMKLIELHYKNKLKELENGKSINGTSKPKQDR